MSDFWLDQATWPRDTPGMVFLGRAVNSLGRALFGEEWIGDEPMARSYSFFQVIADSRASNNMIARHLTQFNRRAYTGSMAPPPIGQAEYRPKFEFSKIEMDELKKFIDRNNVKALLAKERFKKVQDTIAESAVAGKLETSYFSIAKVDFCAIPSNWWVAARLEQRFTLCRLNPGDPFGSGGGVSIFVARKDLEVLLQHIAPATSNDKRKCSVWLKEQFLQDPDISVSKPRFQEQAKRLFGVGPKPFKSVWDEVVKEFPERTRAGPKKKIQSVR
jgi:hypothetical protein